MSKVAVAFRWPSVLIENPEYMSKVVSFAARFSSMCSSFPLSSKTKAFKFLFDSGTFKQVLKNSLVLSG